VKRRNAFTLVELLVVIGIIALLISILLPALSRAREQAYTIKCSAAMRQIGTAFVMYSNDYKGMWPVVKMDLPLNTIYKWDKYSLQPLNSASNICDEYWFGMVGHKYLSQAYYGWSNTDSSGLPANVQNVMNDMAGSSAIWGCPKWRGTKSSNPSWNAIDNGYTDGKVSVFECGYAINPFPFYKPGANPTDTQAALSGPFAADAPSQFAPPAHWYKQVQYSNPSDRAIVVEGTLWLLGFRPTGGNHTLQGQSLMYPTRIVDDGLTGAGNFDYYRHGRAPNAVGDRFAAYGGKPGGRVGTNVLYCDGHVSTVNDARLVYKSIRMQEP